MTHLSTEDAGANDASYATVASAILGPPPSEALPASHLSHRPGPERIPEKRREHTDTDPRGVQRSLFPAVQGPKGKKKLRKRKTVQESTSASDESDTNEEAEFAKLLQLHAERAKTSTTDGITVVNGELDPDTKKEIESKLDQKRILRENTHFNKLIPPTLPQDRGWQSEPCLIARRHSIAGPDYNGQMSESSDDMDSDDEQMITMPAVLAPNTIPPSVAFPRRRASLATLTHHPLPPPSSSTMPKGPPTIRRKVSFDLSRNTYQKLPSAKALKKRQAALASAQQAAAATAQQVAKGPPSLLTTPAALPHVSPPLHDVHAMREQRKSALKHTTKFPLEGENPLEPEWARHPASHDPSQFSVVAKPVTVDYDGISTTATDDSFDLSPVQSMHGFDTPLACSIEDLTWWIKEHEESKSQRRPAYAAMDKVFSRSPVQSDSSSSDEEHSDASGLAKEEESRTKGMARTYAEVAEDGASEDGGDLLSGALSGSPVKLSPSISPTKTGKEHRQKGAKAPHNPGRLNAAQEMQNNRFLEEQHDAQKLARKQRREDKHHHHHPRPESEKSEAESDVTESSSPPATSGNSGPSTSSQAARRRRQRRRKHHNTSRSTNATTEARKSDADHAHAGPAAKGGEVKKHVAPQTADSRSIDWNALTHRFTK